MSRNKKYVLSFFTAIFLSGSLYAQDYVKDMQKISANYSSKGIHFRMNYLFFPDSLASASDSMQVFCEVEGANYYYKIHSGASEFDYVKNSTYSIVVDHLQKAIALSKSTSAKAPAWNVQAMDSLMKSAAVKIQYRDKGNQEGIYDIHLTKGVWNNISIEFNKTNYTLTQVTMHTAATGKLVGQKYDKPSIRISYYGYGTQIDKAHFSETTYFSSTQSPVVLAPAYKHYQVLDYIHTNSK